MTTWRNFSIGPDAMRSRTYYAPGLMAAFDLARRDFGSATLTCYGAPS